MHWMRGKVILVIELNGANNPKTVGQDTCFISITKVTVSLDGVRKCTRYQNIEVEFTDSSWKKQRIKLSGWPAQICQHECDHLSGIII